MQALIKETKQQQMEEMKRRSRRCRRNRERERREAAKAKRAVNRQNDLPKCLRLVGQTKAKAPESSVFPRFQIAHPLPTSRPPAFLSLYPLTTPNKFHFNSKWIKNATFRNRSQSRSRSWAKAGQGRARQDELCSSSETTVKRQASQILLISRGTTTTTTTTMGTTTTTMGTTATTKGNNKKTMRKKQQSKGKARNWTAAQQQRDSGDKGSFTACSARVWAEGAGAGARGQGGMGQAAGINANYFIQNASHNQCWW